MLQLEALGQRSFDFGLLPRCKAAVARAVDNAKSSVDRFLPFETKASGKGSPEEITLFDAAEPAVSDLPCDSALADWRLNFVTCGPLIGLEVIFGDDFEVGEDTCAGVERDVNTSVFAGRLPIFEHY